MANEKSSILQFRLKKSILLLSSIFILLLLMQSTVFGVPIYLDPGGPGGGGGSGSPKYAVIIHGFMADPSDLNVIRDEVAYYYGLSNILMVDYYSSNKITGSYNVFTPIGPYKDSNGQWVVAPEDKSVAKYVKTQIINWLRDKPTSSTPAPVDLIAHSMGGLVIKSLIKDYFPSGEILSNGKTFKIRKVVTMGTPHQGTTGARFLELVYNLVLSSALPEVATLREMLRAYIAYIDSGIPEWIVNKILDLVEVFANDVFGLNISTSDMSDIYNNIMASIGFTRDQAEILLNYTFIQQISMMIPGSNFLKHINQDPTPGPSSIQWYSLAGTYSHVAFNGVTVPQGILDFAFKIIPAYWQFRASVNLLDLPNLLPATVSQTLSYIVENYQSNVTITIGWGLTNPDENWFSFSFIGWPYNDGVVNTFSARNPGSTMYTYNLDHSGIYSSQTARNRVETILVS